MRSAALRWTSAATRALAAASLVAVATTSAQRAGQVHSAEVSSAEADATLEQRITHAFRICLARDPSHEEMSFLKELHTIEQARLEADPTAVGPLINNGPPGVVAPLNVSRLEWATWYALTSVLLNLDETITRG